MVQVVSLSNFRRIVSETAAPHLHADRDRLRWKRSDRQCGMHGAARSNEVARIQRFVKESQPVVGAIRPKMAFAQKTLTTRVLERSTKQERSLHKVPPEGYFMANHGSVRRAVIRRAVARRRVKRAVTRRAVKRAVARGAVKRTVARRAVKRAVARRVVRRALVRRALVKRAVARRAVRRAFGRRALKKAALKKMMAADFKRMRLEL
jgi:hypothetical protein